ncbi:MAG: hypothetical protein EB168_09950 [Euryarchaeota archaeon]|nr:hypothetical protein [Euryarchaeota archaeon]
MAQPVRQVAIRSPGYQGLNTELSPINGDPEFALVADNCVVDQIGRLTAREAFADYQMLAGFPDAEITKLKSHIVEHNDIHGTHVETPVFIWRDGDVTEVPVTNTLPVGIGKRLPVFRGRSLEITGTPTYGAAYEKDGVINRITLPAGYEADLLTAELLDFKDDLFLFAKGRPFCRLDGEEFKPVTAQVSDDAGNKVSTVIKAKI